MTNSSEPDPKFEIAKEFVLKRKSISTPALMHAMDLSPVEAVQMISKLEEAGVISWQWDRRLGGFPVLQAVRCDGGGKA